MTIAETAGPRAATSADLLRSVAQGDSIAWTLLIRRFEPMVQAVARGYRLQDADSHDIVQRTWLRLLERHAQLRNPDGLGAWLATTARRECLRLLRNQARQAPISDAELIDDPGSDTEETVTDLVIVKQAQALIDCLPGRSRMLMRALFDEDPPGYRELARRTGIPIGSIGPTRARALRQLRALIGEPSALPEAVGS
jgi:RNA polymerase sigma factor (sigma-70 family)